MRVLFRCLVAASLAALPAGVFSEIAERTDRSLPIERLRFNKLANSTLTSRAIDGNVAVPQWLTVAGAGNTTPIEVTTPIAHGLATGDEVLVKGVLGNVAANGWWTVTATGERTFTLDGSSGGGEYAGGGSIFPAAGQPPSPGTRDGAGSLPWTPWFSAPAVARETEFFQPTGEVYTFPEIPPVNSFLSQEIDGSLFEPGQNLCLSIEARMPEAAIGDQRLKILVTAVLGSTRVYSVTFPASFVTPDYRRFSLCFRLDDGAVPSGGVMRVEFIDEHLRGIPKPMYWARPMLNEGIAPVDWTPEVEPMTRVRRFY
ncbi:MAG TPA: hypothetical protein VFW15_03320 [Thermoanaerobaculia bacterium]|nr:hypothetical protein [Thermoanaerobaculia bacterium]